MIQIQKNTAGKQIVVFDAIDSTVIGGKHLDKTLANTRFPDGIIPAGTVVVEGTNGMVKVINVALTDVLVAGCWGLTSADVAVDDFPLVAIVNGGTARIDALPALEKTGIAFLKSALPKISFY